MMAAVLESDTDDMPLSNQRETILGATIPFLIIASIAVILRFYARLRVLRCCGLDDAVMVLAWLSNITGHVFIYLSVNYGLGRDFDTLSTAELKKFLQEFYFANATYTLSTSCFKISLLLQYMRMCAFQQRLIRISCWVAFTLVAIWTVVFSFFSWFPCFPVHAYWDLTPGHCYGFGAKTPNHFATTYESQLGTNLLLNIIVLVLPIVPYARRGLSRREIIGVFTLSLIGIGIVAATTGHLGTLIAHNAGWLPFPNFTYYAPLPIIFACIEVDLAILAASIPVFYPIIESGIGKIFVTKEVMVTTQQRSVEQERAFTHAMDIETSSARSKTDSEAGLRRKESYLEYNIFPTPEELFLPKPIGHITQIETNNTGPDRIT